MGIKKVLLIQGTITHYRVPVFNELAKRVDLTVLYSYGALPENISFRVINIPTVKFHYKFYKKSIYGLAKKYDAIIIMFDLSYMVHKMLTFLPRNYKTIYWGIGVSASYNDRFDENKSNDKEFIKYIKRADACVFYSSYPVEKYCRLGINKDKLFVANNTVEVLTDIESSDKNSILFVGSLYKQKRIDELLENYKAAFMERQDIPKLIIIGEGDEYKNIENWIYVNKLNEKIELKGGIYDEKKLSQYFASAIICISPDQAGLTVLKSMGYGVPFVTLKNAITGGEIFNIADNVNGLLLNSCSEIKNVIIDTCAKKEKYIEMGKLAKEHYFKNRKIEMMVDGFEQAINYVCK